ncbi:hypothetical protein MMC13_000102 [Lambiella insularis]|nr:hypothetical protein [Lambiella insularis]
MSSSAVGPVKRLWFKWRSLKLPWRRRWLAGMDLSGNTFWEFKDAMTGGRTRRIAQSESPTHYSDIQISPQWHQWLRHTRADPPSIHEQQSDVQRQVQLKQLARLADERWAAKPSFLDAPKTTSQPSPATLPRDPGGYVGQTEPHEKEGVRNHISSTIETEPPIRNPEASPKEKADPWKNNRGNPGEKWQPTAWTPGSFKR